MIEHPASRLIASVSSKELGPTPITFTELGTHKSITTFNSKAMLVISWKAKVLLRVLASIEKIKIIVGNRINVKHIPLAKYLN